jgi:hypothetical protein
VLSDSETELDDELPDKNAKVFTALKKARKEILSICLTHACLCDNPDLILRLFKLGVEPTMDLFTAIAANGHALPVALFNSLRFAPFREGPGLEFTNDVFAKEAGDWRMWSWNRKWFSKRHHWNNSVKNARQLGLWVDGVCQEALPACSDIQTASNLAEGRARKAEEQAIQEERQLSCFFSQGLRLVLKLLQAEPLLRP